MSHPQSSWWLLQQHKIKTLFFDDLCSVVHCDSWRCLGDGTRSRWPMTDAWLAAERPSNTLAMKFSCLARSAFATPSVPSVSPDSVGLLVASFAFSLLMMLDCKQIRRRYRGRLPQPPTTQSTTAPPRMSLRGANCDGTTVETPLTAATVSSFSLSSAVSNVDGESFSSISAPGSSGRVTGVCRSARAAVTASLAQVAALDVVGEADAFNDSVHNGAADNGIGDANCDADAVCGADVVSTADAAVGFGLSVWSGFPKTCYELDSRCCFL